MSRNTYQKYNEIKGYAPTGCLLLDLVVGGGRGLGFPFGWMVNIVGDKSSGKTFLGWEIIAANYNKYKKRLKYNYDGAESGNTFETEPLYGIDLLDNQQNSQLTSNLVEEFDGNTSIFLNSMRSAGQRSIYIIDSLDGLSDRDKEKQELEFEKLASTGKMKKEGSYNTGTASHLSKQYFRTKAGKLSEKNVLLLVISQVRENLNAGVFQKKHYRAGGKAMDFYAHTCLWLYTIKKITKNDKVIGVIIRAKTEKSKTPRPFRECAFSIYFDYGIDDIGSSLDYLYDLRGKDGELKKSAQNISWGNTAVKERSLTNLKDWLKDNNKYDEARKIKFTETGKRNLSKDWIESWIENNEELKVLADKYFGQGITRAALISRIEEDPKLYKELNHRVVEKWEDEEAAVRSTRKRKYS